jgi:hypothetical protein
LRRTTTFTSKRIPQVIIILDLKEVEIGLQPIIEEKLQSIFASKLVEKEELQQPIGEE